MSLHAVFSPQSVAIIGASTQPGSVGNDIVKNLAENFKGKIYPINPKGGELYGLQVYENIKAVPHSVDLVVIAVPSTIVPEVLTQAGKKKIKAAIVISAGFKEIGNQELENQLVTIAKKYNFSLIGPNCLGVMNPHLHFNASFAPTMPKAGSIAFLSQSGALGVAVLDYAKANDLGVSKFLSVGNKAAVGEAEMLEYLANDPATKVILLYVEQLSDFPAILKVAHKIRRVRHPKPIIVLKSGQTSKGAQAAQSHTGALAGNDALYDALFRQAGMIRASSVEELFLYAECFIYNPLLKKDRVAIVTNAGGIGVLVTDALVRENLNLAQLSDKTQKKLQTFLPPAASVHNPVDILGDAGADRYAQALDVVIADENVDAIVVLLTPQSMTEVEATAKAILAAKNITKKPIIVSFLGGERVKQGIGILQHGELTNTDFPESAAEGLGILHRFSLWRNDENKPRTFRNIDHKKIERILKNPAHKNQWLAEDKVLEILEACRLPVIPWSVIHGEHDFSKAIRTCGKTMALKIISPEIIHKSDFGGVMLHVKPQELKSAYEKIITQVKHHHPKAKIEGILVMQQIDTKGIEVILGAVRDPHLGALVGCGMGGVFTEAFNDAAFGLAPISELEIKELLSRLKIWPILQGARGQKKYDVKSLVEAMARLSQVVTQYPQIAEVDINPLLVFAQGKGGALLDARIRIF